MKHISSTTILIVLLTGTMQPVFNINIGKELIQKGTGWVARTVPWWVPWVSVVLFCGAQWQRYHTKWQASEAKLQVSEKEKQESQKIAVQKNESHEILAKLGFDWDFWNKQPDVADKIIHVSPTMQTVIFEGMVTFSDPKKIILMPEELYENCEVTIGYS